MARNRFSATKKLLSRAALLSAGFSFFSLSANAQALPDPAEAPVAPPIVNPITLVPEQAFVAQAGVPAERDAQPIDLTPANLPSRTHVFQSLQTETLYHLPSRMYLNANVENSVRLETNIFQTLHHQKDDFVYRVLPNVTLGYALDRQTRISANYFLLRDTYADYSHIMTRNIHNIGFKGERDFQLGPRTTVTAAFMARELLITHSKPLNDLMPQITMTRRVGRSGILYGGVIGQIRFVDVLGIFQEGDQFYSLGTVWRRKAWTFIADNTFITNFGRRNLRFGPNNQEFVLTLEADRKLYRKLPATLFIRAQPIFNMGANEATGYAGFNFRLFGGIRVDINKPAIFPVKIGSRS